MATTLGHNRFSHKLFEPTPWTIAEAETHCVGIFEKLRLQREQGRFCDVILKVHGREFPAHRCVLASCSPWFDSRLKVHKTMKEIIEVRIAICIITVRRAVDPDTNPDPIRIQDFDYRKLKKRKYT
jgi:hypothetical protein